MMAPRQAGTPPAAIAAIAVLALALVGVLVFFLVIKKDPTTTASGGGTSEPGVTAPPNQEEENMRTCINNVKQVSLAAIMYSSDYDDMYPATYSEDVIMPYTKNSDNFICPTTSEHYAYNVGMQNISMTAVNMPAMVVLFYEGSAQMLSKPHDDRGTKKGVVGFTDGHVKAVEDESSLFWRYDQETP